MKKVINPDVKSGPRPKRRGYLKNNPMRRTRLLIATGVIALAIVSYGFTNADDITIPTANATSTATVENSPVTIFLSGISNDSGTITFATSTDPSNGSLGKIAADGSVTYTPNNGFTGTDSFEYLVTEGAASSATTTATITVTSPPVPDTATLAIRDGATLIGPVTINLPAVGAPDVDLTATGSSTVHAVGARSVLALFSSLDAATSSFDITNLSYSYDFKSYLLNCVAIPSGTSSPDCFNWTYAVNNNFPFVGMDKDTLQNGDIAYLIFGSQWQVSTDKASVSTGESFTVTAQEYDPSSGTYLPASGVVVGAVQFDFSFNTTEFATSTTDANGHATLSVATAGTYDVGIQEAGYFPNVSVVVSVPAQGGGGGSTGITHSRFNIPSAISYLTNKQNADGSFDSALFTDWAAIALATSPSSAQINLKNYMLNAAPTLSSPTDFERHAMALEALGINPYSGTPINYIAPILNAFDGTQIGDLSLDNDDIFALFPLLHAGYTSSDPIIQKEAAFILSKQKPDGSWDETPDMTAAAIQALGPLFDISGVNPALGKAAGYLASREQNDGSWSNIDSTSWVQTAINGIIEAHTPGFDSETPWTSPAGFLPTDALANAQQPDGAAQPTSAPVDTRVWSTSYALVAASGKSWDSILQNFSKPSSSGGGGSTGSVLGASTSTTATATASTTPAVATTTPPIATSTPPIATTTPPLTLTTSTTTSQTPPPPQKKKVVVHPKPKPIASTTAPATPITESQTASVAVSAPSGNFLSTIWHAITSFFSSLF
jgi:hypothetical protein